MASRCPSAPGERTSVPPPSRSPSMLTTSGWRGESPLAPTGTTGSKLSGNSRPRPEGPGGTSLRPPRGPPSEALARESGGFVGSRRELHDGDEPHGPPPPRDRCDRTQPVPHIRLAEKKHGGGGIKPSLVSIHGATTSAEPVPCTEGIPRRTWPSDNAPRDQ